MTELLPEVMESIINVLLLISTTVLLVLQAIAEFVQGVVKVTSAALVSTQSLIEGGWSWFARALPLVWHSASDGVLLLFSLLHGIYSISCSALLIAYSCVYNGVIFVVPYTIAAVDFLMQFLLNIVTASVRGILAVITAVWTLITILVSSLVSLGTCMISIVWNASSLFLSGEEKHRVESFGSESMRGLRGISEWSVDAALQVLVITVALAAILALLFALVSELYYSFPLLRDYWLRLSQQFQVPPLREGQARQNVVDNTQHHWNTAHVDQLRQRGRNVSSVDPPHASTHMPHSTPPPTPPAAPTATSSQQAATNEGEQKRLCVVCLDNEKQVLLRPCRHYCVCEDCSKQLRGVCPMCRANFTSSETVHIYYD